MTYLDVWRSGTFCIAVKRLSEFKKCRQGCLLLSTQSFYSLCLGLVVHSLAVFPGMCHSSTRPGTSLHVTQPILFSVLQFALTVRPGRVVKNGRAWCESSQVDMGARPMVGFSRSSSSSWLGLGTSPLVQTLDNLTRPVLILICSWDLPSSCPFT